MCRNSRSNEEPSQGIMRNCQELERTSVVPYHALTCLYVPLIIDVMAPDSLGVRIRRARERKHWTQVQLAAAVGVSARAVGDWERDVKAPRNRLGALEQVLDADLTGVYGDGYSDSYSAPRLEFDPGDRDEAQIADWLARGLFTLAESQAKVDDLRARKAAARRIA